MKVSAVKALIVANVAVYVLQAESRGAVEAVFALWPLQPVDGEMRFHLWQLVTYAFLHDPHSVTHVLFNMIALWMFGMEVERHVGVAQVLLCYFASVLTAAVTQLFVPALLGTGAAETIGASGGVFGLLLAYAYLFPFRRVILLFPPIPMPAWLFATLYAALELGLGVTGRQTGVAHFAHLGGMIGSAMVISQWRVRRAFTN